MTTERGTIPFTNTPNASLVERHITNASSPLLKRLTQVITRQAIIPSEEHDNYYRVEAYTEGIAYQRSLVDTAIRTNNEEKKAEIDAGNISFLASTIYQNYVGRAANSFAFEQGRDTRDKQVEKKLDELIPEMRVNNAESRFLLLTKLARETTPEALTGWIQANKHLQYSKIIFDHHDALNLLALTAQTMKEHTAKFLDDTLHVKAQDKIMADKLAARSMDELVENRRIMSNTVIKNYMSIVVGIDKPEYQDLDQLFRFENALLEQGSSAKDLPNNT